VIDVSKSIDCSCSYPVTLLIRFCDLGVKSNFGLSVCSIIGIVTAACDWRISLSMRDAYIVSKSPRPAPSCHWTRLLILEAGTREPRMQRSVARKIARLIRALTNPLTTE
jgi:hypothetical protein